MIDINNPTGAYVHGLSAASYSGADTGAKLAAAAATVGSGYFDPIWIPSSLAPVGANTPALANDIHGNTNPRVVVIDERNAVGTVSNGAVKAGLYLYQQFDANEGTGTPNSDSGATAAFEAHLTAGSGSTNGPYGENVGLYAGVQREAASTRSGWAANFLITTKTAPTATMSSYGLEVDVNNDSGTDATLNTILDGIAVFASGNNRSRFGLWVAKAGQNFYDGVHIGAACTNSGLSIDKLAAGVPGIVTQSPIQVVGGTYFNCEGSIIGNVGGNASWVAGGAAGSHFFYTDNGNTTVASIDPNGKITAGFRLANQPSLAGAAAGSPVVLAATGSDANINVQIVPKGTGKLSINPAPTTTVAPAAGGAGALPATPAGFVTIEINGVDRKMAYY